MFQELLRHQCIVTDTGAVAYPILFCESSDCPSGMHCQDHMSDPNYGKTGFDNFGQGFVVLFEVSVFDLDSMNYFRNAFDPSGVVFLYLFVTIVIIALVINNLFVALVCYGFARAREEISKELAAMQTASRQDSEDLVMVAGMQDRPDDEDKDGDEVPESDESRPLMHQDDLTSEEHPPSLRPVPSEDMFLCLKLAHHLYNHPHFETAVLTVIVLNSITMAMPYYGMSDTYEDVLEGLETTFLMLFVVEMLIKIAVLGLANYIKDAACLFDGTIVVIGLLGLILQSESPLAVLRLFRISRIGRTAKALKENEDIQALLDATIGMRAPLVTI